MRLFIVTSSIPHATHDRPEISAVDIVEHELIAALARLGYDITLQPIFNVHRRALELAAHETADVRALEASGIAVLDPIPPMPYGRQPSTMARRLARVVGLLAARPSLATAYPAIALRPIVGERIRHSQAEAVLTIWSPEGVAASTGPDHRAVVAYQGDVDFQPGEARARDRALFGDPGGQTGLEARMRTKMWLSEFRSAHLRLMRQVDVIANVTATNASFYTGHGHPRSVYVRNVWRETPWPGLPAPPSARPVRIVGHAGRLDATGSTYGLRYLFEEVLPALDRELADIDHRVEIIGAGPMSPTLRPHLSHPRVVVRGFVDDLDEEIRNSTAYLLLNNAGPYRAAFTRHLVAWSVGACLVVHANSREAIPEISPLTNALVGSNAQEIASLLRRVIADPSLAKTVRLGGRRAYETWFTPTAVAAELDRELRRAVG